ncbi:probable G-protein coupled receptor Mth-like 10 [Hyalella azteca]|uniref:Probable G-protein coupled receptor Mth-like 10 n=1 Tax=Hyalella azteca TaxID=294128 RepID=A0A8B7NUF3_HYAAZ|nr:probable G-protein coupled receptor Mth-like 10 [Hyalella azteca]
MGPGAWTLVGVGHLLLLVCIVAHCLLPDLRALQGQYILCMVVTLLLYNLMLFPASAIDFPASHVACIALKAIKYFFFCGVFLWFSVVCFDVWRTLKRGEDVGGRRRFVLYSTYVWVLSAVLTTAVLVLSISTGAEAPASSPANSLPMCSLGRE